MKCFYCPEKDASLVPWDSIVPQFVCAWTTKFLRKTSEKKCKKNPVQKQWGLNPCQQTSSTQCIPLDHCLVLQYSCSGTIYRPRGACKSVLHTHPAHSGMQMGSLCAFILFQQALFVHGEPIFSGRQVKKKCKKIPVRKQWELYPRQQKCVPGHIPLDHQCALLYPGSGTI